MARPSFKNIFVRPSFAGSINGDFEPPADPGSTHTLGRLLRGTILRGDLVRIDPDTEETFLETEEYHYLPEWAPGTTAVVACLQEESLSGPLVFPTRISLRTGQTQLDIADGLYATPLLDAVNVNGRWLSLASGENESYARNVITDYARSFFAQAVEFGSGH